MSVRQRLARQRDPAPRTNRLRPLWATADCNPAFGFPPSPAPTDNSDESFARSPTARSDSAVPFLSATPLSPMHGRDHQCDKCRRSAEENGAGCAQTPRAGGHVCWLGAEGSSAGSSGERTGGSEDEEDSEGVRLDPRAPGLSVLASLGLVRRGEPAFAGEGRDFQSLHLRRLLQEDSPRPSRHSADDGHARRPDAPEPAGGDEQLAAWCRRTAVEDMVSDAIDRAVTRVGRGKYSRGSLRALLGDDSYSSRNGVDDT